LVITYIFVAIIIGIVMDGAFFDRIMTSGDVLWSVQPGYRYRNTLFPRIIATVVASAAMGYAAVAGTRRESSMLIGTAAFTLSLVYAVILTTKRQRRRSYDAQQ
jgi:hypothetical protein